MKPSQIRKVNLENAKKNEKLGYNHMDKGDFERDEAGRAREFTLAIDFFQKAVDSYQKTSIPKDHIGILWYNMGVIYEKLVDHQNAIRCYDNGLQNTPKGFDILQRRACCYSQLSNNKDAEKDYEKAYRNLCREYDKPKAKHSPEDLKRFDSLLYDYGLFLYMLGRFERALELFLKIHHKNVIILYNIGICHGELKQHKEALKYLKEANNLNEEHDTLSTTELLMSLGMCHKNLGEYDAALDVFEQVDKRGEKVFDMYKQIGSCYEALKLPYNAIDYFTFAIERNSNITAYFERGYAFYLTGNYSSGIKDLSRCIEKDINSCSSFYFRGCCYVETGDLKKARNDFESALNYIEANKSSIHKELAIISAMEGKFESSHMLFDQSIAGKGTNDINNMECLFLQAVLFEREEKFFKAIQCFHRVKGLENIDDVKDLLKDAKNVSAMEVTKEFFNFDKNLKRIWWKIDDKRMQQIKNNSKMKKRKRDHEKEDQKNGNENDNKEPPIKKVKLNDETVNEINENESNKIDTKNKLNKEEEKEKEDNDSKVIDINEDGITLGDW